MPSLFKDNDLAPFIRRTVNIIFNARLRIYLLRMLLGSSTVCLISAFLSDLYLWYKLSVTITSSVILVHHCSSVFVFKWMFTVVDIALTLGEFVTVMVFVQPWTWFIGRYDANSMMVLTIALYIQASSLGMLLAIRLGMIIVKGLRMFYTTFDFLENTSTEHKHRRLFIIGGFSIWRKTFSNESPVVSVCRGIFTIVVVMAVAGFLLVNIIIEPIQETGRVPQKLYRSADFPVQFNVEFDLRWRIIAFVGSEIVADTISLRDAVGVKPLWEPGEPGVTDSDPPCIKSSDIVFNEETWRSGAALYPDITGIEIICPDRMNLSTYRDQMNAFDYINAPSRDVWPDILITVNFTILGIGNSSLGETRGRSLSIVTSLTNDSWTALAVTSPIPLVPDVHLMGAANAVVRQRFKQTDFAALGLSTGVIRYLTVDIPFLVPDPSPLIPRNENTASLRLFMQNDFSDWNFVAGYREKSVWAGLSAVGGFWTSVNGVFTILFGTSLMMSLFGVKPLSVFGLFHKITSSVADTDYASILPQVQSDDGFAGYVSHHFIQLPVAENAATDPEMTSLRSRHGSFSETRDLERTYSNV